MTKEDRIKANEQRGYILVASFDGWEIYKHKNEVGAWTYLSDKFSADKGALPIFHTTFVDKEELIAIAKDAYGLELKTANMKFWKIFPWLLLSFLLIAIVVRKLQWYSRQVPPTPDGALLIDTWYNNVFSPIDSGDTVLFGTSRTQMFRVDEYFPGRNIHNRGIPSNTLPMMIQRLPEILQRQPAMINIEAGICDIYNGRSLTEILRDYQRLLSLLNQSAARITIMTLPSVYNHPDSSTLNEKIEYINTFIRKSRLEVIDMNTAITRDMIFDNVHENKKGYDQWAEKLQPIFERKKKCYECE